jgi:hypothetical protein
MHRSWFKPEIFTYSSLWVNFLAFKLLDKKKKKTFSCVYDYSKILLHLRTFNVIMPKVISQYILAKKNLIYLICYFSFICLIFFFFYFHHRFNLVHGSVLTSNSFSRLLIIVARDMFNYYYSIHVSNSFFDDVFPILVTSL